MLGRQFENIEMAAVPDETRREKKRMKLLPLRSDIQAESTLRRGPAAAMIEIDRVSQIFQTSGRQKHLALSEISLTIEDGAFVSILGPSGCGNRRCSILSAALSARPRASPQ